MDGDAVGGGKQRGKPQLGFLAYLASWGPGIAAALTWLGAGDVVASMAAGSEYGYSLLWAMALAVLLRALLASTMAKYQLCNPSGESIIDGLSRVGKWFPWLLLCYVPITVFLTNVVSFKACAEVWNHMVPVFPFTMWVVIWAAVALALIITGNYHRVEICFKVILGVMSVAFFYCVSQAGIHGKELVAGLFLPGIPPGLGYRSTFLVLLGVMGGIGGSISTVSYVYFIIEKGWKGPTYRRVQLYDISFSAFVMILLNLAVWVLAAEVLRPMGIKVSTSHDMAAALAQAMGAAGQYLFYIGLWAAAFSTAFGVTLGSAYLLTDLWRSQIKRQDSKSSRYIYRIIVFIGTVLPVTVALTNIDFVTLSLFSNAVTSLLLPILIFGTAWITSRGAWVGQAHTNSWPVNVALCLMGLYSIYLVGNWLVEIF